MTPAQYKPVDVLVIGAGNAAANAALSAHEAGATVAMLETAPETARGGNSAFTGGAFRFVYDGIDELLALAPDIADLDLANIDFGTYTEGQYFDDMGRLTDYRCDPELTEVLIGGSYQSALWLKKHGVKFQPALGRQAFKVDGKTGTLTAIDSFPTEKQPRAFNIDPSGKVLLAVGELSNSMTSYAIDKKSGKLTKLKEYPMGKKPNWVEIVKLP